MKKSSAFTLIELLIVVAIIAILAAIAVPNFLEAQTRAKIARTSSDMRALAVALESYFSDYNQYPIVNDRPWRPLTQRIYVLTTPIAYIATIPRDPFPDLTDNLSEVFDMAGSVVCLHRSGAQYDRTCCGLSLDPPGWNE